MNTMFDQLTRLVMLHDTQGKVLVLLSGNRLLNLVSVWKHSGRRLQPIGAEDARKFFAQSALDSKKGVDQLFSLPILIDPPCSQRATLEVMESHSGRRFTLERSALGSNAEECVLGLTPESIDARQPKGSDTHVITQAVEKFTALRIKQRLEDTLGLPPLPLTAQKVISLRSDPASGVPELVPVVNLDPSLSAQVMSWAASPYYAAPSGVDSVQDAIVRILGYDLVVNLALGIAMGKTLKLPNDEPQGTTPYWLQALYSATLTEALVKLMPSEQRPRAGLVYLAGLLHNFGYLALAHIFPPHFTLVSRYIEANPHLSHEYIEKQIINVTREQVGAWLMRTWKLPDEVCDAIRWQNDPSGYQGEHRTYVLLIHVVIRLLRQQGVGDGSASDIPDAIYNELGLTPQVALHAFEGIHERKGDLIEMTRVLKVG